MKIRHASAADLPAIIEIYNAAIPARRATADTEPISVASRVEWLRDHDSAHHPLWVVCGDDPAAPLEGWLSFQPFYGRPAYRATSELSIYVAPASQRKGIGRALLSLAVRSAPGLGLTTLLGFIFGHNDASLALFSGFGFERWGRLPGVAELDGIERDLVIVGLRLGSRLPL
ncbi:MAG TPA: GNAT family N-acetyltransferase [Candidatus Binatia bacterium]|jgi:phosphinothricin acetyltransferase